MRNNDIAKFASKIDRSPLLHMFFEEMHIRSQLHGLENEALNAISSNESMGMAASRSKEFRLDNRAICERSLEELIDLVDSFHGVVQLNFQFPQRTIGPVYAWSKQIARLEIRKVLESIQLRTKHLSQMRIHTCEPYITCGELRSSLAFGEQQALKRLYCLFHATGCVLKIRILDATLAAGAAQAKNRANKT
jgi:hypothetical protein